MQSLELGCFRYVRRMEETSYQLMCNWSVMPFRSSRSRRVVISRSRVNLNSSKLALEAVLYTKMKRSPDRTAWQRRSVRLARSRERVRKSHYLIADPPATADVGVEVYGECRATQHQPLLHHDGHACTRPLGRVQTTLCAQSECKPIVPIVFRA